jgi:uncharacterized protein (TIGR00297 family)
MTANPILIRAILAFSFAIFLSYRGFKKQSLSKNGSIAAFCVGLISFLSGYRFGFTLILFYQTSSWLTKFKQDKKSLLDAEFKPGGQRGAIQVFSCSLLATILASFHFLMFGEDTLASTFPPTSRKTFLLCAYLGHYACCAGDTWASELGVLSQTLPRLVTKPWKQVPAGTNGGISQMGTLASILAGIFIGAAFAALGWVQAYYQVGQWYPLEQANFKSYTVLGAFSGLLGSILDSVLGATLQATYYDKERKCIVGTSSKNASDVVLICGRDVLTNEQVNMLSVAVTTVVSGWAGLYM